MPAARIAIILNPVLPADLADEATEELSGGLSGHSADQVRHGQLSGTAGRVTGC